MENGFKDFDKAKKDALWKEWSKRVDENFARKVKSGLLSADDLNAIRNHFGLDSRSFKGVEGSARNDGVGGNGDGGVCLLNWIGGRQSPGIRRQVETGSRRL